MQSHHGPVVQNATRTPLTCRIALLRRITLHSNTSRTPYQIDEVLWSMQEGPLHPEASRAEVAITGHVRVPPQCAQAPSVHGELVQCVYAIRCSAVPAGGCCGSSVAVKVPLTVPAPPDTTDDWELPAAPAGWQPEKMEPQVRARSGCRRHADGLNTLPARHTRYCAAVRGSKDRVPFLDHAQQRCDAEHCQRWEVAALAGHQAAVVD